MIVVSGTKRSGTSMWMAALQAAGFPSVGHPFAAHWEESIKDANPRGFHESILRQGIFFATNPHPDTGRWMHPDSVRRHVVKVFVPGLVRSDFAYIDQVVGTMRNWRAYGASLKRLTALEDAWLVDQEDGAEKLARAKLNRSPLPPPVDWFFENHELLRDFATRRYPVNLCTFDRMLRDPERELTKVLDWLGGGDLDAAVAAVEPGLRTQVATEGHHGLDPEHAAVFDELYAAVDANQPLSGGLIERINEVNIALVEVHGELSSDRQRQEILE